MRLRKAEAREAANLLEDPLGEPPARPRGRPRRRRSARRGRRARPPSAFGSSPAAAPPPHLPRTRRAPSRPGSPGPGRRSRRACRRGSARARGARRGPRRPGPRGASGAARGRGERRRPGSGPAARAPPGRSGRRASRGGCGAASASGRGSRSGTRRSSPRAWIASKVAGVVERDPREVDPLAAAGGDLLDAALDRRQHPEPEQVDLQEAGVGARVLVPLDHLPSLHRRRAGPGRGRSAAWSRAPSRPGCWEMWRGRPQASRTSFASAAPARGAGAPGADRLGDVAPRPPRRARRRR